ncbi:MAG: hypothetical protein Q7R47_02225 [Candidatus Diapherotrites archaeon]|nr:hypothetical protein [Candidatus Diapherotrites archaeon]
MFIELSELLNPQKLPEKMLERDRYVQGQLNLIGSKLDKLEKIVSVGMPLAESEETMERLENVERDLKVNATKSKIYGTVLKEIKTDLDSTKKLLDEKGSLKQMMLINERIKNLESVYETFSSNKTRDIFTNMLEILKNLETRLKTLEEVSHSNASLMFENQVEKLRGTVGNNGQPRGQRMETVAVPSQQTQSAAAEKPQGHKGGGITGFFRRLFGRE